MNQLEARQRVDPARNDPLGSNRVTIEKLAIALNWIRRSAIRGLANCAAKVRPSVQLLRGEVRWGRSSPAFTGLRNRSMGETDGGEWRFK
jgi:hypothetical protein